VQVLSGIIESNLSSGTVLNGHSISHVNS
jgi:hypothetical protein